MEQYRPLIYVSIAIVASLAALRQTRRKPEEIMRNEKPKTDSFITTRTNAEVTRTAKDISRRLNMKVYKSEQNRLVLTSGASLFSWGYVLSVEVESPNEWSSRVKLSLFSKAETGYGNRFARTRKLNKLIEDLRKELKAGQS